MESYIVIEGKRIELPKELVANIKEQLEDKSEYITLSADDETYVRLIGEIIEIGRHGVNKSLKGKCLVLGNGILV